MEIVQGNAGADGAAFNHWFVGDLAGWSKGQGKDYSLRQSTGVEIKWGRHAAGERRVEWAQASPKRTISLLVRGRFLLRFRSAGQRDLIREVRLVNQGDYALWAEGVEHTWIVEEDSVILTVRWVS